MKINEYINIPNYINNDNIIKLNKYEKYIQEIQKEENVILININEEILENEDINEIFENIHNKIVLISTPDIDFPPPKKPYSYDLFFNKTKLPKEYLSINYYEKINKKIIDIIYKNNLYVFTHALSTDNTNINFVPLGVYSYFNHYHLKQNEKKIICYANFGLSKNRWFGNPRNEIYELIKDKEFILKENIIDTNILNRNLLNVDYFYEIISKSKFAICPRGCGIDTYRLWDCICLGCIPIVEKYDGHKQFENLPILFIDNIKNYSNLTEDFLNKTYEEYQQKDFNYDLLLFSNIKTKINKHIHNLKTPQKFGVYLQCYKNSYATYKCLENFRNFYPESTVVLLSDNGYDYSEMAKFFNCFYIHETENLWLTYKDFDSGNHINNSLKLINRIYNAFNLCKEEYVMWLEDDVIINGKITDTFKYNINGYCPNYIQQTSVIELSKTYCFIHANKKYNYSGHGGSVFHKKTLLKSFENKKIVFDIILNWKKYDFASDLGQDLLFSILVILNKGTIGPYYGHCDDKNNINLNIIVQHQYKYWYNKQIPQELEYLVKII